MLTKVRWQIAGTHTFCVLLLNTHAHTWNVFNFAHSFRMVMFVLYVFFLGMVGVGAGQCPISKWMVLMALIALNYMSVFN